MRKIRISFKNKVLIPTIAIFIISVLIISANNYRLLYSAVQTKTDTNLDIFTDNILAQMGHLDIILDTTEQTLNEKHIAIAKSVAYILDSGAIDMTPEALQQFAESLDIIELNIVNSDGIMTHSNIPEYIGFDYKIRETTRIYMALTDGTLSELSEEPRISVTGSDRIGEINHYTGVSRTNGEGFIQLGFNAGVLERLHEEINIEVTVKEIKPGNNGYGMVLSNGLVRAHPNEDMLGMDVSGEDWLKTVTVGDGFAWIEFNNMKYYAGYKNANDYTVIGLVPEAEYHKELNQVLMNTVLFLAIALIIMTAVVYIIMNNLIKPIKKVTEGLGEIAKGNLDARVEGDYNDEFALIKEAVNDMAVSITSYLNDKLQAERTTHEVELARLDLLVKVHYDALTSVYNRRYLDENLDQIIRSLSRMDGILSVLMIDIDFFKDYNDAYGHNVGDECLKAVAKALTDSVTREDDFVARYGGEEFIVVLRNTDEKGARIVADKMLENVRELRVNRKESETADPVTISIGITTAKVLYTQAGEDYIKRADEAMYMSKHKGRNQYTFLCLSAEA